MQTVVRCGCIRPLPAKHAHAAAKDAFPALTPSAGSPGGARSDYSALLRVLHNHTALALLLWAGLGPGALSTYLQVCYRGVGGKTRKTRRVG